MTPVEPNRGDPEVSVVPAPGVRCPRCWRRHPVECNFDGLCDRCVEAILADHPGHGSVPFILESLEAQRRRWPQGEGGGR